MLPATFVHLRQLQYAAVEAVRRTGALSRIEFARTPETTLSAALETRDALQTALMVAQRAGVLAVVDAIVGPAKGAVNELVQSCREELETRRAS